MAVTGKARRICTALWLVIVAAIALVLLYLLLRGRILPHGSRAVQRDRYLVGAHSYVWFPKNLKQGYLRDKLLPPQSFWVGDYDSRDPRVAKQHIAWCSRYGVDFLTLDWWPNRPAQNQAISEGFLKASNLADIRFCIFYETWSLGFDPKTDTTVFDDASTARFERDMCDLADLFFAHPQYLRIEDRPVVFLYLSRTFFGDYAAALSRTRAALRKRGFNVFFVGDEVFWAVIADHPSDQGTPMGTVDPQVGRISQFDAITGYNPYDWGQQAHSGYGAESTFVADVQGLFRRYREACGEHTAFIPGIIPGYNDRGVRAGEDHFVIPRAWNRDVGEGSFLSESFDRLVFPFLDPDLNMVLITSWNEWNEDTAIEPLVASPPTYRDRSRSGDKYTQGYSYEGHGLRYLEVVRDKTVAVSGRVTGTDALPRSGVEIAAWRGSIQAGSDRSDSQGYYTLSRLRMPAGEYRVSVPSAGDSNVTVRAAGTTTGVNFCVASPR